MLFSDDMLFDDGTEFKCCGCANPLQWNIEICRRCNKQNDPPNVRRAKMHKTALAKRVEELNDNLVSNEQEEIKKFGDYIEKNAKIILALSIEDLNTILQNNRPYTNYHIQLEHNDRQPAEPKNDIQRTIVDAHVHHKYEKEIVCAAMATGNTGAWGYGDAHVALRPEFFTNRLSLLEWNAFEYYKKFCGDHGYKEEGGHRAIWQDRSLLALAKHGRSIIKTDVNRDCDYDAILLSSDHLTRDRKKEEFIEINIYGNVSISSETIQKVTVTSGDSKKKTGKATSLKYRQFFEKSKKMGIEIEYSSI